jgi:hypothetical protein
MIALPTIRPCELARRARAAALVLLPVSLLGCGSVEPPAAEQSPHATNGANDPAWVTGRAQLPPPDADRINYDERTRTLTLYDLPANDRWMVQMPGDDSPRPAAPQQRVPADAELSEVKVYYARPGVKPSRPVSVKMIRDCGQAHSSLAGLH